MQTKHEKAKKSSLLMNLGLMAGVMVFMLLAFEIGLRIFWQPELFWEFDPVIGVRGKAGAAGFTEIPGEFRTRLDFNSLGFRDRERKKEKPAGVKRLVVLGDSFVEAVQVSPEKTFHQQLGRMLSQKVPTEVIPLGIQNLGTFQELLVLEKFGLEYQPDAVLLIFFPGNDLVNNSAELDGHDPKRPYPKIGPEGELIKNLPGYPGDSTLKALLKKFYVVRFLASAARKLKTRQGGEEVSFKMHVLKKNPDEKWQQAWKLTEKSLAEIKKLCEQNNVEFYAVSVPALEQCYDDWWLQVLERNPAVNKNNYDREMPAERFKQITRKLGVPAITTLEQFQQHFKKTGEHLHFRRDEHLTPKGHDFFAGLVYDFLKDKKPWNQK